jgi:hypothetical protein
LKLSDFEDVFMELVKKGAIQPLFYLLPPQPVRYALLDIRRITISDFSSKELPLGSGLSFCIVKDSE